MCVQCNASSGVALYMNPCQLYFAFRLHKPMEGGFTNFAIYFLAKNGFYITRWDCSRAIDELIVFMTHFTCLHSLPCNVNTTFRFHFRVIRGSPARACLSLCLRDFVIICFFLWFFCFLCSNHAIRRAMSHAFETSMAKR
jgi:hypothetical protein